MLRKSNSRNLKSADKLFILLVFIFVSCSSNESKIKNNRCNANDSLMEYLHTISDSVHIDSIKYVVYITEKGCPSCQSYFSEIASNHFINKKNTLLIVNSYGQGIDISYFLSDTVKNVVFEYSDNFKNLGILKYSGFIELNNNQIDTIIDINPDEIQSKIDYITKRIGNSEIP